MEFHFPVTLHDMTANERVRLNDHLQSLNEATEAISSELYSESHKCTEGDLQKINVILKRYCSVIFGKITDYNNNEVVAIVRASNRRLTPIPDSSITDESSPAMKMLKSELTPFVYSMKLMGGGASYERQVNQYRKIKFSRLGEAFVTLIANHIDLTNGLSNTKSNNSFDNKKLATNGVIILHTLDAWIHQEIHLIADTVSYALKEAEITTKLNIIQKASKKRHECTRYFKEQAAVVARKLWEEGSTLPHHKMAMFLMTEYKDENGLSPFEHLPSKDQISKNTSLNVLRNTVKAVALEMNRRDLITGQKGSIIKL